MEMNSRPSNIFTNTATDSMMDILGLQFMQNAYIAGIMIAVITSVLGVFLVLRQLSLIGDGLAHASFAGVAAGLMTGTNPLIAALVVATIGSIGIHELMERAKAYGDSAIALILSTGMGLAVVMIGYTGGFTVDLFSYLFGSILTLGTLDLWIISGVFGLTMVSVYVFYDQLVLDSFNKELAQLEGRMNRFAHYVFIVLTAMAVVVSIRAVGVLLVTALIVIPALTSLQFAESFKEALIYSSAVSVLSVLTGVTAAYSLDLPPSGVIVMIMVGMFAVSLLSEKIAK